jgi:uncharacterized protein with HEPN domain
MLKSAVEMLFIRTGACASRVWSAFPQEFGSIEGLHLAISVQTHLLHTYGDDLDDHMIWDMTQTLVPGILQEIESRL